MSAERRFQVAFVCTGNRFRSPLAAALFAADAGGLAVDVSSAGVLELHGVGALDEAVELARPLGVDLSQHRAQGLTTLELHRFDLVVGFERSHVHAAVVDAEAPVEVTYTLPELVDLLEAVPQLARSSDAAAQARARIAQAHAQRNADFRRAVAPEIRDPLGRGSREQRRIAAAVCDSTTRLAELLLH